jgi:Icc-related predicted phosphoesterase
MTGRIRKVLAVGPIRGAVQPLQRLLGEELPGLKVDAVAVVGDLGVAWSKPDTYRAVFKALGETGLPALWIPGPLDAPISEYLRESYNMEIAFPRLRGIHGAAAVGDGQVLFAGMGGEIVDDPDAPRVEEAMLRYPGWEAAYRLKLIDQFDQPLRVLLFATRPAHKGLHEPGSEVVAELIKTHAPKVAIVAGEGASEERLGTSLVICPGRLDLGIYSVIDIHEGSVEVGELAGVTAWQTT